MLVQRIVGNAGEQADGALRRSILFRRYLDSEKIRNQAYITFRFPRGYILEIVEFIERPDHEKYGSLTTVFRHVFFIEFPVFIVHPCISIVF